MSFDVPVLLVAWRRPETTRQVLDAIRAAAPTRLFVACDGPRPGNAADAEGVRACRELIDRAIDWPCEVQRLYRDTNLGCRRGVSGAIDWFFSQVDEGIIVEDDCVPHADFFGYCAELLERYRDDERVWCISGDNFQDGAWRGDGSYYFSRYIHVWGWATWRRAWRHYDVDLTAWPEVKSSGRLKESFDDAIEAQYWSDVWDRLRTEGIPDTWDYQWIFASVRHGGLTALPNRNLVLNVGFGQTATNTPNAAYTAQSPVQGILPLKHPVRVTRDAEADAYTWEHHFHGAELRRARSRWHWLAARVMTAVRDPLHYPRKAWRRVVG
jgi:hypothetical protein